MNKWSITHYNVVISGSLLMYISTTKTPPVDMNGSCYKLKLLTNNVLL